MSPGNPRAVAIAALLSALLVLALAGTATAFEDDPCPDDPPLAARLDDGCSAPLAGAADRGRPGLAAPTPATPTPRTAEPYAVARFVAAEPVRAAASIP